MAKIVSPKWAAEVESKIFQHQPIDVISSSLVATQWLVSKLARLEIPFKIHNLGAGVKRITTDTDTCPYCKRKL